MSIQKYILKDFKLEFRESRYYISVLIISIFSAIIASLGLHIAIIPADAIERIYPIILWISFILLNSFLIGRSYLFDKEMNALTTIIVLKKDLALFYYSKVIFTSFISIISIVIWFLFFYLLSPSAYFLNLQINFPTILAIFLAVISISAISNLLVPMTFHGKLGDILIGILLIPLSMPVLFGLIELTVNSAIGSPIVLNSAWLTFFLLVAIIYLFISAKLYRYTISN
jgi:ABC-type transport system involved in cytochrome c biogenesis permease component